jgi:hypothetical protein
MAHQHTTHNTQHTTPTQHNTPTQRNTPHHTTPHQIAFAFITKALYNSTPCIVIHLNTYFVEEFNYQILWSLFLLYLIVLTLTLSYCVTLTLSYCMYIANLHYYLFSSKKSHFARKKNILLLTVLFLCVACNDYIICSLIVLAFHMFFLSWQVDH